ILCFSIKTTGTPSKAAAAATDKPPDPAPMTHRSEVSVSVMRLISFVRSRRILPAPQYTTRDHRHQRQNAQRRQRNQHLWRHQRIAFEIDMAGCRAARKTGTIL